MSTKNELAFANANAPAFLQQGNTGHTEFDDMGGAIIPRVKVRVTGIQIIEGETVLAEVKAGNSIPLVVVGASPVSRSYYKGRYTQGESSMPDCRSYDGVTPDSGVQHPQSNRCDTCPMNAKGSSTDVAGGKACRFRQNLAVISPSFPEKLLRLPIASTSIFPKEDFDDAYTAFRPYVAKLRHNKLQPFHVITDVRQNPSTEQTHTVFKPVGYVTEEILAIALEHREDSEALDLIYGKFDTHAETPDEEDRKNTEAFNAQFGERPAHLQEEAPKSTTPPRRESRKPTLSEAEKPVLDYTPYEPVSTAEEVTYWKGITVTENLGDQTIHTVIAVEAGEPLPDEEWDEVEEKDYKEYQALKVELTKTKNRRRAATATPQPDKPRRGVKVEAEGEEAAKHVDTKDKALVSAIDSMFDEDEDE